MLKCRIAGNKNSRSKSLAANILIHVKHWPWNADCVHNQMHTCSALDLARKQGEQAH